VESAIKYITGSWWRTAPVSSLGQAQADLDRWAIAVSDRRKRRRCTIAELAGQEGLLALPGAAFPALLEVTRVVSRTAMVAFEGNRYSVPPGLVGQSVTVRARLGELHLEILSPANTRVARHVWREDRQGHGQSDHGEGHGRDDGVAEPAVGEGVSGDLHRCDGRQGRDGQVANKPVYVVIGVTVDGERDISGYGPVMAARARSSG
jgi:hypothetical protein